MRKPKKHKNIIMIAYLLMLIGSTLPLFILREMFNINPDWLLQTQTILFAIILGTIFLINKLKKLKLFVLMILLLMATQWLTIFIQSIPTWNNIFSGISNNFI